MLYTRTRTPEADMEKMSVGCAFAVINKKEWEVLCDGKDKCWDILTPRGWRACFNSRDLWEAIRENE